jgi:hypothetical protein
MRIYLPATFAELQQLVDDGMVGPAPLTAFAVTDGLRAWYDDGDDGEALEYAAMLDAARASLRLIHAEPGSLPRRAVIAADVEDTAVTVRDDIDRGVVRVTTGVALDSVASVHVDGEDAEGAVAAAADSILRAELGDETAQEVVDDVEGFELSWYAAQEIAALVDLH